MNALQKKVFVLDTNVILHDAKCINHFEEHDLVIPITVIEELDKFKRGNEDIHFQARQFLRHLDDLTGQLTSEVGVPRGEGLGNIRVMLGGELEPALKLAFIQDSPDNRILNTALRIKKASPDLQVVLVSKDTNLRLKAKAVGVIAEDYEADKLRSFDELYTGRRVITTATNEEIDQFFDGEGVVAAANVPCVSDPISNESFVIKSGTKSVLVTYNRQQDAFIRVHKSTAYGIQPRNAEQVFAIQALMNDDIRLVTVTGKAGTGKTLLALATALEQRSRFKQILLARPIVPLSNRDLGFLPGDIQDKLDPYMQPLFDNLNVIRHQFKENDPQAVKIREMLDDEKLLITPLSYIRGRSLQRMFFIVDEAQNLTPLEIKTIITRAAEGTKIVFTGDLHQIDQPYLDALSNGLSHLVNRMKGQDLYAHITLEKGERSALADLATDLL